MNKPQERATACRKCSAKIDLVEHREEKDTFVGRCECGERVCMVFHPINTEAIIYVRDGAEDKDV